MLWPTAAKTSGTWYRRVVEAAEFCMAKGHKGEAERSWVGHAAADASSGGEGQHLKWIPQQALLLFANTIQAVHMIYQQVAALGVFNFVLVVISYIYVEGKKTGPLYHSDDIVAATTADTATYRHAPTNTTNTTHTTSYDTSFACSHNHHLAWKRAATTTRQ